MALKILLVAALSISIVACDSQSHHETSNGYSATYPFADEASAEAALSNWRITCHGPCSDSVAQVLVRETSHSVSVCTGSLIAKDLVLTNSHCFDIHQDREELCKAAAFIFPDNSPSGRQVELCDSVVSKSDITDDRFSTPDFMIFRLRHASTHPILKVSRQGLNHDTSYTVSKINPFFGGGSLETSQCTALYQTFLFPNADDAQSPIQVGKNCNVIPGNSGSPVTDTSGALVAVVFAKTAADHMVFFPISMREKIDSLSPALMTNAACIDFPNGMAGPMPAICNMPVVEASIADFESALDQKLNSEVNVQAQHTHTDGHFGFQALSDFGGEINFRPYCFAKPLTWISSLQTPTDELKTVKVVKVVKVVAPHWSADVLVDDELKFGAKITPLAPTTLDVQFNPNSLMSAGSTPVSLTDPLTGVQVNQNGESWGICTSALPL